MKHKNTGLLFQFDELFFSPFYLSIWKVQNKVLIQKKTIFSTILQSTWSAPGSPINYNLEQNKKKVTQSPFTCCVSSVCWSPLCNVSVHPRSPYLCVASLDHLSCLADACLCLWTCPCCISPSTSPEICLSSLSCFSSSSLWTWTWTWISASLCPATCLGLGSSSTLTGIEICFFRRLYFLPFPRGNSKN